MFNYVMTCKCLALLILVRNSAMRGGMNYAEAHLMHIKLKIKFRGVLLNVNVQSQKKDEN